MEEISFQCMEDRNLIKSLIESNGLSKNHDVDFDSVNELIVANDDATV